MQYITTPHGAYRITQVFGVNKEFYRQFGMIGHNGLDIAGLDRNYAFVAGDLFERGFDGGGYGYYCKIRADNGDVWIYGHFAGPIRANGRVSQWQDLGQMGSTGISTGIHCHVGVKPAGYDHNNGYYGSVDPLPKILEAINNDDGMTQEEQSQLNEVYTFVTELRKGVDRFRQVKGSGELVYDAKMDSDNNASELVDKVWADDRAMAALMRAAGMEMITKEESKKKKYVKVRTARSIK